MLLKTGDVFSNINLPNSLKIIQERLGDFGYAFARAFPVTRFKDESNTVDFEINVNFGNRCTSEELILVEMQNQRRGYSSKLRQLSCVV